MGIREDWTGTFPIYIHREGS